jgi:DNA-binding XRE family transcriptional regulator
MNLKKLGKINDEPIILQKVISTSPSVPGDDLIKKRVRLALVECRKTKKLTQAEVGKAVGKSATAVASWEQGLSMPDASTLYQLAAYYGKPIAQMYGEEG